MIIRNSRQELWIGVRVGQESWSLAAEVRFENERGCDLVDDLAAGLPVFRSRPVAGAVEDGMGVGGGVALVEQMERRR